MSVTISELIDEYLKDADFRGVTRSQRISLENVRAHLGGLYPDEITRECTRAYTQGRLNLRTGKPIAPATARRELAALQTVLRHGQVSGSTYAVTMPGISPPRDRHLSPDQEQQLLGLVRTRRPLSVDSGGVMTIDDKSPRQTRLWLFVQIALQTGARRRAIETLTWDQVDLNQGVIDFRDGGRLTKKRRVPVPISKKLDSVLVPEHARRKNEYVLRHPGPVYYQWRKAVEHTQFHDLRIHDLRRTFATRLARAGVDMWKIAGLLGDSLDVTVKHYAHHAPDYLRDAVNAL